MNFLLNYSLKRFWRKRGQIFITAFFLCLGFWGWLLSESTQTSIRQRLEQNAKQILSADITVSVRREFKEDELEKIRSVLKNKGQISQSYEFFAMMSATEDSRLVQVRVVDDAYPFYGSLQFDQPAKSPDLKNQNIWVYDELKDLMSLFVGEKVTLGNANFKISRIILEDQTQTFRLASLAPKIFIHLDDLKKTGLIQFGSTFTSIQLIKLSSDKEVEALTETLKKQLADPGIDITSFKTLPDDLSGPTQRLSDFLGLTSLVSLLFCSLSLFYLLQIWSAEQQKEKAALAIFGLSQRKIQGIEFIQSTLIAILSTALSTVLVLISTPIVEKSIQQWFAADFSFQVTSREIAIILCCQIILLAVLTYPFEKQTALTRLLKDQMASNQKGIRFFMPLLFLIWPFAIFASRSWKNGTYFFLAIISICFALMGMGWVLIRSLQKAPWKKWTFVYSIKALSRQSTASWAFIVTVGVCSALLNLLPQIQSSVQAMMNFDRGSERPALFMFDIQQEQMPEVDQYFEKQGMKLQATSPMVRARILKINDTAFERQELKGNFVTREDENAARIRNRTVNLTYVSKPHPGNKIVEGEEFNLQYDPKQAHPFLSIEKSYAERLDLKLGDIMTFDVQGIEISGQIKNFREVRWSRFEPNFFILFQDGVLNEAPQTFLTSLPANEKLQKSQVMNQMAKNFPNVSIIDVERMIRDIIKNLDRVGGALRLMTGLSFLTGMLALIFLLSSESLRRATEVHLLKILGSEYKQILRTRINEIFILASISLVIGLGSSYLISYFIVDKVFKVSFTPEFYTAGLIAVLVLITSFIIVKLMTAISYKRNSFAYLKKED